MYHAQTTLLNSAIPATRHLQTSPRHQVLFFVRRFIANVDWTADLLSLLEKLIHQKTDFTRFERMIAEDYLQLQLHISSNSVELVDRLGVALELEELLVLREQILSLCHDYALRLTKAPSLHPLARAFKQVLAKVGYQVLNDEENAILREAYLTEKGGALYTWAGKQVVTQLSRAKRMLWRLVG